MSILKPIIYFSLFNHPLTRDEIFNFSEISDEKVFYSELKNLLDRKILFEIDGYILTEDDSKNVTRRIKGNFETYKIMPKVKKVGALVSNFPFIKGVAVSRSLSKGYYDADSDFDFFVITKSDHKESAYLVCKTSICSRRQYEIAPLFSGRPTRVSLDAESRDEVRARHLHQLRPHR